MTCRWHVNPLAPKAQYPFSAEGAILKVLSLNIEMKTLDIPKRCAQFSGECSELHWELFAEHSFHRVTHTGGRDQVSSEKTPPGCCHGHFPALSKGVGLSKTGKSWFGLTW